MLTTIAVVDLTEKHDNINFVCSFGIPLNIGDIGLKPDKEIVVTEDLNIQKNKHYKSIEGLDILESNVKHIIKSIV